MIGQCPSVEEHTMSQSVAARKMNHAPVASGDISQDSNAWTDRRATAQALRAASARNASGRRRFIDPTTCEREYSLAEREFMDAMQAYKHSSGRMFPTWSEVLEVLVNLGYEKTDLNESSSEVEA